jgi:FkbM family methyltransferase
MTMRDQARAVVASLLSRLPKRLRRSLLVTNLALGPFVFTGRGWLRLLTLQKLPSALVARVTASDGFVALGVRDWAGQPVYVRPTGTDWETAEVSLIARPHRPPADLSGVRTILDLGTNIGVTVADLAHVYDEARVLGVEPDAANVSLAMRNVAPWRHRVTILQGAAWTADGEIEYGGERGEWAYRVLPAMDERTAAAAIETVPAFSMLTLVDRVAPGGVVDYVKMDIEGAERFVLADGQGWADRVRCLQVEVHLPYDVASCCADLERLGFRVAPEPNGIPSVTALR